MYEQHKLERFYSSLEQLESSLLQVRTTLTHHDSLPEGVQERLFSYLDICEKQRAFGTLLRMSILEEDYEEVGRHIKLINGLSTLMLEDVPEFIEVLKEHNIAFSPLG